MCPPMKAHWRHLANTIERVHPTAHLSPRPKRQIDRFSRFCTADGRKCLYFTMGTLIHQNCPFPCGDLDLLSNTYIPWTYARPKPIRHIDRFSRFCTDDCRVSIYFTMVRPFLLPIGHLDPCNTWFLGPHPSPQRKRQLDRFSRFCRAH